MEHTEFNSPLKKAVMHKHRRPFSRDEKSRDYQEIVIRVISTWGHEYLVGLSKLEIFDQNMNLIPLLPSMIYIRNPGNGIIANPVKLISGDKFTDDSNQM